MTPSTSFKEKVSIVLPTYDGARYLRESLDSCLLQTYSNIEVIVVVDGSSDDTTSILSKYLDERVKIIIHDLNQGLSAALNSGFAHSNGSYLTWTSDDNRYSPHAIETMLNYLKTHDRVGLVYAPYWEIDSKDQVVRAPRITSPDRIQEFNVVGACFLYHRFVYESIGQYEPSAALFEDYEYWLRVTQQFKIESLSEPLYFYRIHKGSLTNQRGVVHKRWRLMTRLKLDRFGLPWHRYWLEMARIDIDEAFLCYRQNQYERVPRLVIKAMLRNPIWILNRGVVSIIMRSLMRKKQ